jgi:glutathione S-transferase
MKHYFNPMSRGATTAWMLEELGAAHEQVIIDFAANEQHSDEFRAINPMCKVPTLVDGDAVVTETAAICAYLADKFIDKGLAPPIDSTERGKYFRYLFFPGTTLEPLLAIESLGVENANPMSMGFGDKTRVMASVAAMTPDAGWVLDDRFSAADVVFGGALAFFSGFKMLEPTPKVAAYIERIMARPAYQKTHAGF